jgi:vitamin B12 transporter
MLQGSRACPRIVYPIMVWGVVFGGGLAGAAEELPPVQSEENVVVKVPEVVTIATKTPLPISQVTSAIEVIDGEEIQRKRIKTVIEALRLAQGVFAFSQGGPGTIANVRIRGAETKHTLVAIDGVIVNSPTNGAYNFADLTTDNIERIEIVRGAQSMLYGADAVGGVIAITTKKGAGKPSASAFFEYGSFATLREGAQVSGAKGIFDFSASLSRWDTSGFSAVNYKRGAAERDGYHNWQASGKLGVSLPREGRLELNLRWVNADNSIDSASSFGQFDVFNSKGTNRALMLSGMYSQRITPWWDQKLTLAQNNERQLSFFGTARKNLQTGAITSVAPSTSDLEVLNRRLEWQHNFQVGKPLLLTAGYQFREEQGDSKGFYSAAQPNRLLSAHSGFAQAQLNVQDRLIVTGGVRQDRYNVFGDATTYRVTGGFLIHETGTKLRSSYGTGFRTPTLNDLFFANSDNPNLRPEKSQSSDVGVDQALWQDRIQLSATYFWNHFRDLIVFQNTSPLCPPSATFGCPVNISQSKTQGWELGATVKLLANLEAKAQYTMTLNRDLISGKRLPRRPIDMVSAGLSYQPIAGARVNVDYRFVGTRNDDAANTPSQRQGSFGVVNMSGSYDFSEHWQAFGRIENLFNQDYEEVLYFGTPIRSVFGGLKFTY